MRLDGRGVLVTGGAGGIGAAIARRMAQAGVRVAVADREHAAAQGIAATIPDACALAVDVADEASVAAMMDAALTQLGRLDALVHCAGIGVACPAIDLSFAEWRRVLAINLDGTFLCSRAAARVMKPQGKGAIIAIASTAGEKPSAGAAPYSASKAGVINLMRTLAIELAPHGIRANAIAPGPVETDLVRMMHSDKMRSAFTARTPLARYARPEEIAGAAVFLASDEASYVTGEVLHVDGGYAGAGITLQAQSR